MMTMKKIALALLATSAMAEHGCAPEAPWGAQSNFAVEISGGAATMGASPYSTTPTPAMPAQTWNNLVVSNFESINSTFNVEVDTPAGFRANWNKMTPSANRLGFAGQLNLHYTAVQGHFAGGVYAGVGYNGAHSSSTIKDTFNNTVYKNSVEILVPNRASGYGNKGDTYTYPNLPADDDTTAFIKPAATNALAPRANKNDNLPTAKTTVSSGLMFSAGTRMGAMIGNVFPHFRLGWAIYQLKAHMTNQMPAGFEVKDALYANSDAPAAVEDTFGFQLTGDGTTTPTDGGTANMGLGQNFGDISSLYNVPNLVKVSSKGSKWANAITLGGGVDWAFQKMTLGFYYQAAICQRVTFDTWNKDIAAGLESSVVDFPTKEQDGIGAAVTKLNSGGIVNTYGKTTPKVSISPLIHTVMISAKYVMNKA
jgi:hypothetical protein